MNDVVKKEYPKNFFITYTWKHKDDKSNWEYSCNVIDVYPLEWLIYCRKHYQDCELNLINWKGLEEDIALEYRYRLNEQKFKMDKEMIRNIFGI